MPLLALLASFVTLSPAAPSFIWIEGETPTTKSAPVEIQATNYPQLLSGGKWLASSGNRSDLLLSYQFDATAGDFSAMARVGFEWARSPFDWRINGGNWESVPASRATLDPVRLAFWMEVAWLNLGSAKLKAGQNTVEFRFKPREDGQVVMALDAIAFVSPGTRLEGKYKPGEAAAEAVDVSARNQVFGIPVPKGSMRSTVRLDGAWEVSRWDDANPDLDRYQPIRELPKETVRWQGVQVPGDAWQKPELTFANRLVYRTKFNAPKADKAKSYSLHFSGTTWIVSVFVNGRFIGDHKGVLVPWDLDISAGVQTGKENQLAIIVKGPYYAMDILNLLQSRNLPREQPSIQYMRWVAPVYPSSKGEGEGTSVGLVNPVTLTVTGPAYTSDVFVNCDTSAKKLSTTTTFTNIEDNAKTLTVRRELVNPNTGMVEQALPDLKVTVPGKGTQVVVDSATVDKPRLWWPVRNAQLTILRTSILDSSAILDAHDQTFGFRDIKVTGRQIRINGVARNFWNWVEVSGSPKTPEEWLKNYEAANDRFHRFAYDHRVPGVEPHREAQLAWADANGVPGRLSTCIDGMFITFNLDNPLVWENFREHLEQVAKAYRNHPSVMVYSAENELMYINAQNTGQADAAEPKMYDIIQAGRKIDSTKPWMVDGGGALVGNRLEVDCPHYPEGQDQFQPDNAYTLAHYSDHSSRWPWDRKRPLIGGEMFFYAGKLEDQAWIGGDEVFRGREYADRGAGKYARNLIEGLRWQEVAGICPWVDGSRLGDAKKSFSSLAAFTRKRAHRLASGKKNTVLVKVFNDTLSADPVTFRWTLRVANTVLAKGEQTLNIEPGFGKEVNLELTPAAVTTRQSAELEFLVSQAGSPTFEDTKAVSILPTAKPAKVPSGVNVFDASGKLLPWLTAKGIKAKAVRIDDLPNLSGLLLVGPDSLSTEDAVSGTFLAYAVRGNTVLVLEQENPLVGGALPIPIRGTDRVGGYAFSQAPTVSVFQNLGSGDLEDWAGDFPTFKRPYVKPAGGARSLIQSGEGLNNSPLLEIPTGKGVMVLCQMRVGVKLGVEPAADTLLANLLSSYGMYVPAPGKAAVVATGRLRDAIRQTALLQEDSASVASALASKPQALLLEATPANLAELVAQKSAVDRYTAAGGWVMVLGLTPEGLPAFNQVTGVHDPIRPFRVERVVLEHPDSALMATLGNRDLAYYSPQEIMFGDYWVSEHVYSNVVGGVDAAPFMRMPEGPESIFDYKPTFSDNDPYNYVNGLLNSDSWRTIRQLWVPENGDLKLEFAARRSETIGQIKLWNNVNYSTIEKMEIVFDGDASSAMQVVLPDDGRLNEIKIDPPRRVEKSITLVVKSWRRPFQVRDGQLLRLVGIDDVQFLRAQPTKGKIALDNVGGLVAYPRGKGGIFLNQFKLDDSDPKPSNREKKIRVLTTILSNMRIGSASGTVLVPGVNAEFKALDLTRWNNVYVRPTEGRQVPIDLSLLVPGEQVYGDVPYFVSDYRLAPVPQAIFLENRVEVKDIPVARKAEVLYLLHTARVDNPVRNDERRNPEFSAPELARLVFRYTDGTTAEVPLRLGEELEHWRKAKPTSVVNGKVVWSVPDPKDPTGERPVLYSSAIRNPKPGEVVATIDILPGKQADRGVYALLAITTALVKK